jgi:hypothetical protein
MISTQAQDNSCPPSARFGRLQEDLAGLREGLITHPMYNRINDLRRLREFMQIHVFAVWDFMSLVKRLQMEFTSTRLPWIPPAISQAARFANEVVLGEESDLSSNGQALSHFELYLGAMDEIGADSSMIRLYLERLSRGMPYEAAFNGLVIPKGIREFVCETLGCAIRGSLVEVASYFFFGREDVIPDMFKRLLCLWGKGASEVPNFAYYLERHIDLDGNSHGPLARDMLIALAGDDECTWHKAGQAADRAIRGRLKLWDAVLAHLGVMESGHRAARAVYL